MIGDMAIANQSIHILTINTRAKVNKGKNKTTAKATFINNKKKLAKRSVALSGSSANVVKSNKEEYMVIKGHTNHLDFSSKLSTVNCTSSLTSLKNGSSLPKAQ